MKNTPITILLIFAFAISAFSQSTVTDSVRMTAIGAPWWVVIESPDVNFKNFRTKSDGSYFLLNPINDEFNVSLYIEPATKCKSSEECRDFVLNAGNPAWGTFEQLSKGNLGRYSYFEFFRPQVAGRPLQMQDMYAQYVDSGYWVDFHLSKVLFKKEDRDVFERILNSAKFVAKTEVSDSEPIDNVIATGKRWLGVWDNQECAKSYDALTSISRAAVTVESWSEYCRAAHASLGKIRKRELIATRTVRTLSQAPGRSGATLVFQSEFNTSNTIEIVNLTSEKDGSWTVSHYLTL